MWAEQSYDSVNKKCLNIIGKFLLSALHHDPPLRKQRLHSGCSDSARCDDIINTATVHPVVWFEQSAY